MERGLDIAKAVVGESRPGKLAVNLGLERAEPPNSPGPTFKSASGVDDNAGDMVVIDDAGGDWGRGTDAGSAR